MARKRGKGGRFTKGHKGPKKKKRALVHKVSSGGTVPIGLLHKMDKTLTRIDNRLVPRRVKDRLHRMKAGKAARAHAQKVREQSEADLAAKYG